MGKPIEIFICFDDRSRDDRGYLEELKGHLNIFQKSGVIRVWDTTQLIAGTVSKTETARHWESADIILLLVSSDFLNSDVCYSKEMESALERHARGEIQVIPIIIRPVVWEPAPFGELEALPKRAESFANFARRDDAYLSVVRDLSKMFDRLRQPVQQPVASVVPSKQQMPSDVAESLAVKRAANEFDVFICYNSIDKEKILSLARQLKEHSVLPWLDEWEVPPGRSWLKYVERQIEHIKSAAVFVGHSGIGPWQNQQVEALLSEFVERECPLIPVLLPGAGKKPAVPLSLKPMAWVDFRQEVPDPLQRLIWGITDKRPDSDM